MFSKAEKGMVFAFEEGEQVEAKYGHTVLWSRGVVVKVNPTGTFDVKFRDGRVQKEMYKELIRSVEDELTSKMRNKFKRKDVKEARAPRKRSFEKNQKVFVMNNVTNSWDKGRILDVGSMKHDRYDVFLQNGTKLNNVRAALIRECFEMGETVEATVDGRTWQSAEIVSNNSSTYRVVLGNGRTYVVPCRDVRSFQEGRINLKRGETVEARFAHGRHWFVGTIVRVSEQADGIAVYDIEYREGMNEKQVKRERIRPLKKQHTNKERKIVLNDREQKKMFIQGRHLGGAKPAGRYFQNHEIVQVFHGTHWEQGQIVKVNRDERTYDVAYANSDLVESNIHLDFLRHVGTEYVVPEVRGIKSFEFGQLRREPFAFHKDESVEFYDKRTSNFVEAIVHNVHVNGITYDLRRDDDFFITKNVHQAMIRPSHYQLKQKASTPAYHIHQGQVVEARFHGGPTWYRGTVAFIDTQKSSVPQYTIQFNDGIVETGVPEHSIRPQFQPQVEQSVSATSKENLDELLEKFQTIARARFSTSSNLTTEDERLFQSMFDTLKQQLERT